MTKEKIIRTTLPFMKYRLAYLIVSSFFIGLGVFSFFKWGFNLGIDFTGGSIIEYRLKAETSTDQVKTKLIEAGIEVNLIQKSGDDFTIKTKNLNDEETQKAKDTLKEFAEDDSGNAELRFENVGPSVGPDLVKKTVIALSISAAMILFWVAIQFKSVKFGASAVLAMLHDSLILLGSFAFFGHFFGAEVDFLFVTAVLTILSFSVHDTIVVYDRIREMRKKEGGEISDIADLALTQTAVRSFNNSMTIVFMLLALILFGGETVKWFAVALTVGTISGTYSSPFVAVPILVTWDELEKRFKRFK